VQFLDGNPDWPQITDCVYTQHNIPPRKLPANWKQTGILSRSSQGGDYDKVNALRFEDKKGEEVWLYTAHKHTDKPAQRIGKTGRATGVPGSITLGQAKGIASRAIEKATGGKKGGGCDRKDIQKQLDEKFKESDDALLRGVKDARKVTSSMTDALKPKQTPIEK